MRRFIWENSLFLSRNKNLKRQQSSRPLSTRLVESSPNSLGRKYSTKYKLNSRAPLKYRVPVVKITRKACLSSLETMSWLLSTSSWPCNDEVTTVVIASIHESRNFEFFVALPKSPQEISWSGKPKIDIEF